MYHGSTLGVVGAPAIAGAQSGATCNGLLATLEVTDPFTEVLGTASDDVIIVTRTPDGIPSEFTVDAGAGNDSICIRLEGISPVVYEGMGIVTIEAGLGDDYVLGSPGQEAVNGGDGNDVIRAGAGSCLLYTSDAADE